MATAGRVAGVQQANKGRAIVDVIGIGAGVFDRLREMKLEVSAFNAAERTDDLVAPASWGSPTAAPQRGGSFGNDWIQRMGADRNPAG